MSNTRAAGWNHLLWIILVPTILSITPLEHLNLPALSVTCERSLVNVAFVLSTIIHLHYGVCVVRIHLNINNSVNLVENRFFNEKSHLSMENIFLNEKSY